MPSTALATVGYYEPWWMQILKAIVIFAIGLQLVPVILLAERKILGRYQNRNVMDAFGGISRGNEQWTVRASRELVGDPTTTAVGPLTYEVYADGWGRITPR